MSGGGRSRALCARHAAEAARGGVGEQVGGRNWQETAHSHVSALPPHTHQLLRQRQLLSRFLRRPLHTSPACSTPSPLHFNITRECVREQVFALLSRTDQLQTPVDAEQVVEAFIACSAVLWSWQPDPRGQVGGVSPRSE